MRYIEKAGPDEFTEWKDQGDANWDPGWDDFDGKPIKQVVKRALLNEQGYLCCYCEDRVDEEHGHIEHLKPREHYKESALNYENLLYSCREMPKGVPSTCGHARKHNEPVPVSPLNPDCESRFIYNEIGEIQPRDKNDHEAAETIRILNLNAFSLRDARAEIYEEVASKCAVCSVETFGEWISDELSRDEHNRLTPFWGTKKYVANRMA